MKKTISHFRLQEKSLKKLKQFNRLSIIDNTSLTKRLESETNNNFKVHVISQKIVYKKRVFGRNIQQFRGFNIERIVRLTSIKYPDIFAKSYTPVKYCFGKESFIKILKNKSLGKYLLKSPRFTKDNVRYKIDNNSIHRIIIYKHKYKRIIVDEVFPIKFKLRGITLIKARRQI